MEKREQIRIAILDSGVCLNHPALKGIKLDGCTLQYNRDKKTVTKGEEYYDEVGHGTAVTSIISKIIPEADIYIYKILGLDLTIDSDSLVGILRFISQHEPHFHIINMSMGTTDSEKLPELYDVCEELNKKGTIIMAAYDNENTVSFPAAFENVIGVDMYPECKTKNQWEFIENSIVDIRGIGTMQRIAWKEPQYVVTCSTSMTCACISGYAAKFMQEGATNRREVLQCFRQTAQKIHLNNVQNKRSEQGMINVNKCERAAIFPINKETHALFRYFKLTNFDICAAYDVRLSGNIGRNIRKIMNTKIAPDLIVENINNIDYDAFEILILGHHKKLLTASKQEGYIDNVILEATRRKKRVFMFDIPENPLIKNNPFVFYPNVDYDDGYILRFNKLFYIAQPVLGVVGTSSKQGKFSFQLELRQRFINDEYYVGELGTEPHSSLFGFDEIFPCGYNSSISMPINKLVSIVNNMMWNISKKEPRPDIILTGSQASLIPENEGDLNTYPMIHQIFLQAVRPDALFMCVNPDDSLKRIEDSIKVAEGLSGGKVIGLICYPKVLRKRWQGDIYNYELISEDEVKALKKRYRSHFKLPTFLLGDNKDMDAAYTVGIEFFS